MMSTDHSEEATDARWMCCAACGIADIKLKTCGCKLVQYCSVDCLRNHRSQHRKACQQRMAQIRAREEMLFRQPESNHLGDCPICWLPLPLDAGKTIQMKCCSKIICDGCNHANTLREIGNLWSPHVHSVDIRCQKRRMKWRRMK